MIFDSYFWSIQPVFSGSIILGTRYNLSTIEVIIQQWQVLRLIHPPTKIIRFPKKINLSNILIFGQIQARDLAVPHFDFAGLECLRSSIELGPDNFRASVTANTDRQASISFCCGSRFWIHHDRKMDPDPFKIYWFIKQMTHYQTCFFFFAKTYWTIPRYGKKR